MQFFTRKICNAMSLTSLSPKTSKRMIVIAVHRPNMIFMQRMYIFAILASLNSFSHRCTMFVVEKPKHSSSKQTPYKLSWSTKTGRLNILNTIAAKSSAIIYTYWVGRLVKDIQIRPFDTFHLLCIWIELTMRTNREIPDKADAPIRSECHIAQFLL